MGRPKVPLISKHTTLEAALRIIDEEGIEELSIRRLARELDVNGASLYHHFRNKDEILLGAARLALEDARLLGSTDVDWREWFIGQARLYRRALLDHPALVTIILKQHPHRIALEFYDEAVRVLRENGVPTPSIIPLIEMMESFTFGSVLYMAAARNDDDDLGESYKALAEARRRAAGHVDDEQVWEAAARAMVDAALEVGTRRIRPARKRAKSS
ncbi:TetR/AcrR family transcriptional regulator [Amycolatopsis sp. GM8]|uniref:TetR/AcrR family transcriptional regulator n=1 Tax=Amycolatopsis sp. GM8 TaxID=2896530 RepID=UPI001F2BAD30|nr:TetR/AcrR family transcriptional regulator [Amycolatopsis sp. GM8]